MSLGFKRLKSILILSSLLLQGFPKGPFLSWFLAENPCAPFCHPYVPHSPPISYSRYLVSLQFFPVPGHLVSLRSNILVGTLLSDTISLNPLSGRDHFSHPYRRPAFSYC